MATKGDLPWYLDGVTSDRISARTSPSLTNSLWYNVLLIFVVRTLTAGFVQKIISNFAFLCFFRYQIPEFIRHPKLRLRIYSLFPCHCCAAVRLTFTSFVKILFGLN